MRVLGIETSCDETGVALYDTERGLLADALYSQIEIHAGPRWRSIRSPEMHTMSRLRSIQNQKLRSMQEPKIVKMALAIRGHI